MKNVNEIIRAYTAGELTLEEANAALKDLGSGIAIDPGKNAILPGEEERFGLLDTGTGSLDKVEIKDGKIVNCNCGEMYALCWFRGVCYHVRGDQLIEAEA